MEKLILLVILLTSCVMPEPKYAVGGPIVRLHYAPLKYIGTVAAHPWFITHENGEWHRWEIWHIKNRHGNNIHLYKDLFPLNHNTGNSNSWVEKEWIGKEATKLIQIILSSRLTYPYRHRYIIWPGPNSNAYIGWVLRQANLVIDFPLKAIGSDY
jgi:hypothetical protein